MEIAGLVMAIFEGLRKLFLICQEKEQWEGGAYFLSLSLSNVGVVVGRRPGKTPGPGLRENVVFTTQSAH